MAVGKPLTTPKKEINNKKGGFFEGLHFYVELGIVPSQIKKELTTTIENNGGSVDFVISKKTTHVVTKEEFLSSYKLKSAQNYGCFFVLEDFVYSSDKAGRRLDEWDYLFLGDTRANTLGTSSVAVVGNSIAQAFATVSSFMSQANLNSTDSVTSAFSEGVLNIAALCAGLGARVPNGKFSVNTIVNNLYTNVLFNPQNATRPTVSTNNTIATPLFREIGTPTRSPRAFSSPFKSSPLPSFSSLTIASSSSSPSSSSLSFSSTTALKSTLKSTSSTSAYSSSSSPSTSLASPKPTPTVIPSASKPSSTPAPSSYFNFSSSSNSKFASASASTSAPKTVSYSYAQYEEERRKKREEEKAKRSEESGNVLREREVRKKEEDEARKKAMEDKKQELMERRKQEDEERKQKNKEISEAREKRIQEERRKRELAIEKLKQKPTHDLVTSAFFQQWDQEESAQRMKEELEEQQKQIEAWKAKQEAKEKAAQERAERLREQKERKIIEREEKQRNEAAEKAALKNQRREDYFKNKESEVLQKKKEFEEKQAALLEEYLKRQAKRERKALLGLHPELQLSYEDKKIFVGGIKLDDIKPDRKLPQAQAENIRSERINAVLRMFDAYGHVHQRRVFYEKEKGSAHCFVTYKEKHSVDQAMDVMKDAEKRKELVANAKLDIEGRKLHALCVPHANFYVRIPKEKGKKKTNNDEQEQGDDVSSHGGEWEEVPTTARPAPSSSPATDRPTVIPSSSRPAPSAPSAAPATRPSRSSSISSASSSSSSSAPPPPDARGPRVPRHPIAFSFKRLTPKLPTVEKKPKRDPLANNAFGLLDVEGSVSSDEDVSESEYSDSD